MTSQVIQQLQRDIDALRAMSNSRGWALVSERVQQDIVQAAFSISENPLMSEKEIDFRRGAMAAARGLLSVVPALIQVLENDLTMAVAEQATAQPPDAKA